MNGTLAALLRRLYPKAYGAFREVKDLFDPNEILNPGKVTQSRRQVLPRLVREGSKYDPPRWIRHD